MKDVYKYLALSLILLIMYHSVPAEESYDSVSSPQDLNYSNDDDQLKNAGTYRKQDKSDDILVVKETKDTVYVLEKSAIKNGDNNFRKRVDDLKKRGYGFAGGPYYGISGINMKPVEKLCEIDPYLKSKTFYFSKYHYEPFILSGGMGLAGIGNGMRIGGGGAHGSKKLSSAPFQNDSIVILETKVSYGGFIFEKVFQKNKWNIKGGGLIGGGNYNVSVRRSNTVFQEDYFEENDNTTKARFFCLTPYGGCSYSFFPIFHLGVNISLPVFISTEGFSSATGDFYTMNPALLLKFIFGNLG